MSNFIDIYINEREKSVPATCTICVGILQDLQSTLSMYNEGACCDCFISFVEPNRNVKGSDWEPIEKETKEWLLKKKKQYKPMYKFF